MSGKEDSPAAKRMKQDCDSVEPKLAEEAPEENAPETEAEAVHLPADSIGDGSVEEEFRFSNGPTLEKM